MVSLGDLVVVLIGALVAAWLLHLAFLADDVPGTKGFVTRLVLVIASILNGATTVAILMLR